MAETKVGNIPEYTVSELSGAVKRAIEDNFGFVRVRGELGRVTRAASGHLYLDLKDDKAVISSVMWKGVASRLSISPEQGMEVIASGRMSTFPGQSRYQLILDGLEPAGVGALMALYEERKKKLNAEGLFDPERKKEIPFLPSVIGVVTSPSGAVIRDILHRLRERFPRRVIVWPTLVQGRGAEQQIAEAIEGFNALPAYGPIPRPDVLIVARGGGSLEDLWCFNEERVARAAAASEIPLISAVGHETDTTLIDYVADKRAPTPSAAAEMAVPVRSDLLAELLNKQRRMAGGASRLLEARRVGLLSAMRGLGRPEDILGAAAQRVDACGLKLSAALRGDLSAKKTVLAQRAGGLNITLLTGSLSNHRNSVSMFGSRAREALRRRHNQLDRALVLQAGRLNKELVTSRFARIRHETASRWQAIANHGERLLRRNEASLGAASRVLETVSYARILERGFALIRDEAGGLIRRSADAPARGRGAAQFADGARAIIFDDASPKKPSPSKGGKTHPPQKARQQGLFD